MIDRSLNNHDNKKKKKKRVQICQTRTIFCEFACGLVIDTALSFADVPFSSFSSRDHLAKNSARGSDAVVRFDVAI
jgi:hypothetical protein